MTLFRLRAAPFILLEDDIDKNCLPLILELAQLDKNTVTIICYDQPVSLWKKLLRNKATVSYYDDFNPDLLVNYTSTKSTVIIDSVNQMALCLGWTKCLKYLKLLQANPNIVQLIVVLHTDSLSHNSKLQTHINHIASAIVSYNLKNPCLINVQLKKSGKVVKSEEILSFDSRTSTLKCTSVLKPERKEDAPAKPLPSNLSTFKIEVEEREKLEKDKLQLPYMSKIHEGESKVYYEPDAVDDWDEEDPDEDLDI